MNTPLATIELDAFCERCGFNLRSQPIWRDATLGILLCRCPECGAHQSAVGRATALTPWLNRLALVAVIGWVLFWLAFVGATCFGLAGTQVAAVEGLTNLFMTLPDGTLVTYSFANNKPTIVALAEQTPEIAAHDVIYRRSLVPLIGGSAIPAGSFQEAHDLQWLGVLIFATAAAAGAYVSSSLLASVCWFWRPGRRSAWLALPLASSALSIAVSNTAGMGGYLETLGYHVTYARGLERWTIAVVVVAQVAVVAIGLATGRRVVRGVLLVFCPPGVRQLFAFLWHCDGKTMPITARDTAASPPSTRRDFGSASA